MKNVRILRVDYSPGYGDMRGQYHAVSLRKDKNGSWTCVSRDREDHRAPTVTAVCAVSDEAAEQFLAFIEKEDILSLQNRRKSDLFASDYSPWSWNIDYEAESFGKSKKCSCSIEEYKEYSGKDRELLKELRRRFTALPGEKISEAAEEIGR